jgi:hypothetical protein
LIGNFNTRPFILKGALKDEKGIGDVFKRIFAHTNVIACSMKTAHRKIPHSSRVIAYSSMIPKR